MISRVRLLGTTRFVATISCICGILLAVVVIDATLSMASPIFTGQRTRDAIMVAFMGVPVLQLALVIGAGMREDARPEMAIKLYALSVALFAALFAIPAFA